MLPYLVDGTGLAIPVLDRHQGGAACQIKHEEDGQCIVADEREHIQELLLTSQVPDGEGNLSPLHRDGLVHEVDTFSTPRISSMTKEFLRVVQKESIVDRRTQCLDVILIKGTIHILDHEAGLTHLRVSHHPHLHSDLLGTSFCRTRLCILLGHADAAKGGEEEKCQHRPIRSAFGPS